MAMRRAACCTARDQNLKPYATAAALRTSIEQKRWAAGRITEVLDDAKASEAGYLLFSQRLLDTAACPRR
jgi:hypothetical protein